MGREIVRQESEDPGRRSRLWSVEDVYDVLKYNKRKVVPKAKVQRMLECQSPKAPNMYGTLQ
ncbi:TMV resistance protein N-like protein [Corchorus olitorius]|uniref:TMV resistance protein N-like protein n=1 Tax=Corchorus olitorius TaxID=93759 RepID=A0A1R3KEM9_9ROSI|nr:TMV resistance protein N-like protein [Corchorus olitorius]